MTIEDLNKAIATATKELIECRRKGDNVSADIWAQIETNLVNQKARRLGL